MAEVVLPAMSVQMEAKTKNLLDKISEFMDVKYEIESVIVMKVKFHDKRQDFATVVRKLVSKAVIKEISEGPGPIGSAISDPHAKKTANSSSQ